MKRALLAAAAFFCAATAANASVIPTLEGVTFNGTDFTWSYEGTLSPDSGLDQGSRLVIFDFGGYVNGSVFSPYANVFADAELTTDTTGLLLPPGAVDDPTKYNLTFTWTGSPFQTSGGPYAPIDFNGLTARSIFDGFGADLFAAVTVKNNPDGAPGGSGTPVWDSGFITVPSPGAVPEPATWAMMIMGAGAVGAMIRRRRTGAVLAA